MTDSNKRSAVLDRIADRGGLGDGVARAVARATGVAEAEVYGAGSFYHLLADPATRVRVCTGLSCRLAGAGELLARAADAGLPVEACSCLAACDRPPAALRERTTLVEVAPADVDRAAGDWRQLRSQRCPDDDWRGEVGPAGVKGDQLAIDLRGDPDYTGSAFARARQLGAHAVVDELAASGLQGRGGAGFPAAVKWRSVCDQPAAPRYVVLNADEGEPGTFKDREVMIRRPDRVLEGLAIAAQVIGATEVLCYLRGEFGAPWRALERAIAEVDGAGVFPGVRFSLHAGHGAYICGEETALLEALEGKRGMPRLKPPFPTEVGLWGKPTLIHNVETIACVPAIVARGGAWFRGLGRTGPGTKLYCISGHIARPGTYELPLGVSLDELMAAAGGGVGELLAFSPGGASSGFLPACERGRPLDFDALVEVGSMLGSAGVVVINDGVSLVDAVREQLAFFEVESCGQCAPCRIGTRFLRETIDGERAVDRAPDAATLRVAAEVAWEMNEGSICGLGQAAATPLTTVLRHFPGVFGDG